MRNFGNTRRGKLTKGYLAAADNPSLSVRFQYNPEMFTDNISVEYKEIRSPGITYPLYQYVGGEARSIEFTLFLDAKESKHGFGSEAMLVPRGIGFNNGFIEDYAPAPGMFENNSVREMINFLNTFLPGGMGTDDQFLAPPELIFGFGWFVKRVILVAMPTRYTMFDNNLQPMRAEVDLKLNIIQ